MLNWDSVVLETCYWHGQTFSNEVAGGLGFSCGMEERIKDKWFSWVTESDLASKADLVSSASAFNWFLESVQR